MKPKELLDLLESRIARSHWLWQFLSTAYLAILAGLVAAGKDHLLHTGHRLALTALVVGVAAFTARGAMVVTREIQGFQKALVECFNSSAKDDKSLKELEGFYTNWNTSKMTTASVLMVLVATGVVVAAIWAF